MWFSRNLTVQKAFVLSSLLLASGVSAAAIPANLADPASVSVTSTDTHVPTGQGDSQSTSLPYEGVPDCRFCRENDDDEQTTSDSVTQVNRDGHTIEARTDDDADKKKAEEEEKEKKELEKKLDEKCHGNAMCKIISVATYSY
ncbi:hypothetical protein AbraIFM66951_004677 [Aspergillus brasiliensis]|uniref:Uncharacterized protein n=1 Tax=Aspergillus brasiliensis TaxID=319629 RepID=A0A9W6DJU6_9EURO|nr:hypothetical protein AbraCBS73388_008300 [Aspergillus brasiliensis]GKZ43433.1 hypothetical protein AbraIFM66951_004677 [Aspergillus brasiliensis]